MDESRGAKEIPNLSTPFKVKLILIFARKNVHCRVNSVIFLPRRSSNFLSRVRFILEPLSSQLALVCASLFIFQQLCFYRKGNK